MTTHEVLNQVPPLVGHDTSDDAALREGLEREGAGWALDEVSELGRLAGTAEAQHLGRVAERDKPILHTHDRYGHRVDEVEYTPAYHELMRTAVSHGLHGAPWGDDRPGAHVARAAKFAVWNVDAGHGCPISMTYAVVPALRSAPTLSAQLEPLLTSREYDPALRDPATKQGLVAEVFGGKVGDGALAVLKQAVAHRWTATRDLADTLEHLSVVTLVRAAGSESGRLADELFTWAQAVKNNPELRDALSDPARSTQDKAALIDGLLAGKTLPSTATLATQALSGSYRTVSSALASYQKTVAEVHGEGVATVRVARELSAAETSRLAQVLSAQYGRTVHLNTVVDPTVLGGLRVEIGDDVIDGTVSSRLDDARRRIAG